MMGGPLEGLSFLADCHGELLDTIVERLRSTTVPLTDDLLQIRTELQALVNRVETLGVRTSGDDLAWLAHQGDAVDREMTEALNGVEASNRAVQRHFEAVRRVLETVLEVNRRIGDVSDRINVLAINATIEAARAGNAGRGFRVIADHVKALAVETSDSLGTIEATVNQAGQLFATIDGDLDRRGSSVSALLERQRQSFVQFRQRFSDQRTQFDALCGSVLEASASLEGRLDRLSPVVQLHDITVQELENLGRVVVALLRDPAVASSLVAGVAMREQLTRWAAAIRAELTTRDELAALERVLEHRGLGGVSAPPPPELELF